MSTPPAWLLRAVTRGADLLAKMRRRMLPPAFAAIDLGTMSWVAQSLSAFCELGLAEELNRGTRTAEELSRAGFGDEAMIFRLLRSLAAYDVVRYAGAGRFGLGHVGKGLTGPGSTAPMVRYANAPWHAAAYAHLANAIRSACPAFEVAHGVPLFDFLAKSASSGAIFDDAMQSLTPLYARPLAAAYDFSSFEHIVDIGGGTGLLLACVLHAFANLRGTVFELPAAAVRAREQLAAQGLQARATVVEGDILTGAAPTADAYVLAHILHDWNDDACIKMLGNIRSIMPAHARILVYEIVAAPLNNRWSQDRITDLEMMAMLSGRERTREEFSALFDRSGLRLRRIIASAAPESVIEAAL